MEISWNFVSPKKWEPWLDIHWLNGYMIRIRSFYAPAIKCRTRRYFSQMPTARLSNSTDYIVNKFGGCTVRSHFVCPYRLPGVPSKSTFYVHAGL